MAEAALSEHDSVTAHPPSIAQSQSQATAQPQAQPAEEGQEAESRVIDLTDYSEAQLLAEGQDQFNRPTDAEIIAQENLIRSEMADNRPLVCQPEPLSELESEYAQGSPVFQQKIQNLAKTYGSLRRVRGDGNCFIRAFLFGLLEDITLRNDLQERNRLVSCLRQWVPKLKEGGFAEIVFEDALAMLMDQLNSLGTRDPLTVATLENNMQDQTISNMMVMFIRFLVSCELQRRQEFFCPFIMGLVDEDVDVKQFCHRYVEVMGAESDHVHIVALCDALQVPCRVLYLDRSVGAMMAGVSDGGETAVNHIDFIPEALQQPSSEIQPRVNVLYRPGHYDLIYKIAS